MTSVVRRREQDDSGEYSDGSQEIDQNTSGNEGGQQDTDYDSQASDSEHSEDGDSENKEAERRVDDDEDRSNPQYIPKRGTFYEHDDRTAASGEESGNTTSEAVSEKKEGSEGPPDRRRPPRKSELINKWSHDKYNENEQMPKSRDELVAIYGYDIRNEDAPPHARRNRRYGRGPNKYTRTWEDEEAYRRQTAAQAQNRKPPNLEDFPELEAAGKRHSKRPRPRPRSKSQPTSNESLENGAQLRRNASIKTTKGKPVNRQTSQVIAKPSPPKPAPRTQPKESLPALENLTITANATNNSQGQPQRKVNVTVAQQRPVPTEQAKKKPPPLAQPQQQTNPPANKSPPQQKTQQNNNQQQQPASGAESRGGSKRYSSLRQRPLAEPYAPQSQQQQKQPQQSQQQTSQQQPVQQQHRFHPGTNTTEFPAGAQPNSQHQGSPVPQIHPQQLIHQVHRNPAVGGTAHAPSPPHQSHPQPQHTQQVRLGILDQQQLVSHPHHSLHNMPPQPHAIGQLQPSQAYAPPAMMPAQYMQSGSGAVFGGAPMFAQPPPAPYTHQLYTHPNYVNPTQAGGVTYYNCAEQEPLQPRAQRRPTAAIPIVRPAIPERPANSSEAANIDRIVENMFVRKPWPTTHGADSKEKPQGESRNSQEPQSKESSQPNSLTSSSISTDSKPSENKEEKVEEVREEERQQEKVEEPVPSQESVTNDA